MTDGVPKFFITALEGSAIGREFVILDAEVRIGRTGENDIVLQETNVSRHHASIWMEHGRLWIKDAKSKNGVFVNERRINTSPLQPNDILRLGESVFRVGTEVPKIANDRLKPLLERIPQLRKAFSRIGAKRTVIYSVALAVAYLAFSGPSDTKNPTLVLSPAPKKQFAMKFTSPVLAKRASDDEIVAWRTRAEQALRFNDLSAAIQLLQKVVAARPGDPETRAKLAGTQQRLSDLVRKYNESGAREYEKKYYERAIQEWQKVLSLTDGLDPETYRRTEEHIREVQIHLAQKR